MTSYTKICRKGRQVMDDDDGLISRIRDTVKNFHDDDGESTKKKKDAL